MTEAAKKTEKTVAAVVVRDFWDETGERVREGTIIDVSPMALVEGMEAGTLARVK